MVLVQHTPKFVSVQESPPRVDGFLSDVLEASWVRRWTKVKMHGHAFWRFARSPDYRLLLAEFGKQQHGKRVFPVHWWVVGRVVDPDAEFQSLPVSRSGMSLPYNTQS